MPNTPAANISTTGIPPIPIRIFSNLFTGFSSFKTSVFNGLISFGFSKKYFFRKNIITSATICNRIETIKSATPYAARFSLLPIRNGVRVVGPPSMVPEATVSTMTLIIVINTKNSTASPHQKFKQPFPAFFKIS